MSSPKFPKIPLSFHSEVKKRISEYFKNKGKATTGNFKLHFKAIILVTGLLAIYTHLVSIAIGVLKIDYLLRIDWLSRFDVTSE